MVEVKRELRTYRVHYICDNCKKGKMEFYITTNEGYKHQCPYCKAYTALEAMYPYLEYEEK